MNNIKEIFLFPPWLCFPRTLITTLSVSHEPIQPNNKFLVSVCVVQLFSCACVRDIMRKQVLTSIQNVFSSFFRVFKDTDKTLHEV